MHTILLEHFERFLITKLYDPLNALMKCEMEMDAELHWKLVWINVWLRPSHLEIPEIIKSLQQQKIPAGSCSSAELSEVAWGKLLKDQFSGLAGARVSELFENGVLHGALFLLFRLFSSIQKQS